MKHFSQHNVLIEWSDDVACCRCGIVFDLVTVLTNAHFKRAIHFPNDMYDSELLVSFILWGIYLFMILRYTVCGINCLKGI